MQKRNRPPSPKARLMGGKGNFDNPDRVFVRPITGEYNLSEELRRLRSRPRVRKGAEIEFYGGPQHFNKDYVEPKDGIGQTLHIHLEEIAPGGRSEKHGHVNEAVFYILDGIGVEVHDGIHYEWEAATSRSSTTTASTSTSTAARTSRRGRWS